MFCMGLALAWGSWQTGRLPDVARAVGLENPLMRLSVEGLIVGAGTMVVGLGVVWAGRGDERDEAGPVIGWQSLVGLAAMVIVGGLAAWGVARGELVGQTFAAATAGGVFGGLAARVFGHGCSGRALLVALPLLGLAGPLIGDALLRGPFGAAVYAGSTDPDRLAGIAWIMPLDWASGLLMGLPLGLSWAASMVEHHHREGTARAPAV